MLWKKTVRDLKDNKGACAACLVVIIIGLMVYTLFSILMDNLRVSQRIFIQNRILPMVLLKSRECP